MFSQKPEGENACQGENSTDRRHPRIWVLVTDGHKARVFSKCKNSIYLVAEIQQELAFQDVKQIASSCRNPVRRQPLPKEEVTLVYDISAWLDAEVMKESFDRLILVAAPNILDELRQVLSQQVYAHIIAEINKDPAKMSEVEIRAELEKILWF